MSCTFIRSIATPLPRSVRLRPGRRGVLLCAVVMLGLAACGAPASTPIYHLRSVTTTAGYRYPQRIGSPFWNKGGNTN